MPSFTIIVAIANNRAIGRDNQLLWHLPNDLQHFKNITMGKAIVMGRKTFESIGKPLPGRDNIVLTTNAEFSKQYNYPNLKIFTSVDKLLAYFTTDIEVMIIGGGEIYKEFLAKVNKIYLTQVDTDCEADVYFPTLDNSWVVVDKQSYTKDAKHKYDYQFIELVRQ